MKVLSKPLSNMQENIDKAKSALMKAQLDLNAYMMNVFKIKELRDELRTL